MTATIVHARVVVLLFVDAAAKFKLGTAKAAESDRLAIGIVPTPTLPPDIATCFLRLLG
jgi:hypothetical protein